MGPGPAGNQRSAMPAPRALALIAFVLALGLLIWRGNALFNAPTDRWEPASLTEASLLGVLEPVAGEGNVRLTINKGAGKGRKVLILLSSDAAGASGAIERIATVAADIDPDRGDHLTIETAEFATSPAGQLTREGWAELSAFGVLCALLAWLGLLPAKPADGRVETSRFEPARTIDPDLQAAPSVPVRKPLPAPSEAADLARKDPGKAAEVLRGWMKQDGDAA